MDINKNLFLEFIKIHYPLYILDDNNMYIINIFWSWFIKDDETLSKYNKKIIGTKTEQIFNFNSNKGFYIYGEASIGKDTICKIFNQFIYIYTMYNDKIDEFKLHKNFINPFFYDNFDRIEEMYKNENRDNERNTIYIERKLKGDLNFYFDEFLKKSNNATNIYQVQNYGNKIDIDSDFILNRYLRFTDSISKSFYLNKNNNKKYRYNNYILITSNITFEQVGTLYTKNDGNTRVVDRIIDMCNIIYMKGKNYRRTNSEKLIIKPNIEVQEYYYNIIEDKAKKWFINYLKENKLNPDTKPFDLFRDELLKICSKMSIKSFEPKITNNINEKETINIINKVLFVTFKKTNTLLYIKCGNCKNCKKQNGILCEYQSIIFSHIKAKNVTIIEVLRKYNFIDEQDIDNILTNNIEEYKDFIDEIEGLNLEHKEYSLLCLIEKVFQNIKYEKIENIIDYY